MAPTATNVDPSAFLDEVGKPPAGIVLPPRDIRSIVEKTAGYVARNGVVFEDRIREKEKHNPKFSFLSNNDAYNAFYIWRLDEVRAGRGTAVSAGRTGEPAPAPEPEKPQGPKTPADFYFSARMPNISAQDLDVVRLTALFVAKNGRSFMTSLSQREARNYQFDFLRPQHSLYQFFSRLVDQYTLLLQSSSVEGQKAQNGRIADLEANVKDRFHILDRAKERAEWVKFQEQQKQKREEEIETEKIEYAQIDWHDFVVVETVLFDEADDQADLPPPTSLNDLQSASLEQKAAMSLQPADRRIEEAMPTSGDYSLFYSQQQQPQPQQLHQPYPMAPPSAPQQPSPYSPAPPAPAISVPPPSLQPSDVDSAAIAERTSAREAAQSARNAASSQQPMRIRNDYVPRAQAKRQTAAMAVCPNCKEQIPYDELDQHMRIELLDPRWKEQQLKSQARSSTTNLSTSDVAANLKRLASQRSDVFEGVTGQPIVTPEEAEKRRKKELQSFDGQLPGGGTERNRATGGGGGGEGGAAPPGTVAAMQKGGEGLNIEEQIRRLHQTYKS